MFERVTDPATMQDIIPDDMNPNAIGAYFLGKEWGHIIWFLLSCNQRRRFVSAAVQVS